MFSNWLILSEKVCPNIIIFRHTFSSIVQDLIPWISQNWNVQSRNRIAQCPADPHLASLQHTLPKLSQVLTPFVMEAGDEQREYCRRLHQTMTKYWQLEAQAVGGEGGGVRCKLVFRLCRVAETVWFVLRSHCRSARHGRSSVVRFGENEASCGRNTFAEKL